MSSTCKSGFSTNLGFFEGQSHTKQWIATQDDVAARFSPGNEICLWCMGLRRAGR